MTDWKDRFASRIEDLSRSKGLTCEVLAERLGTTPETIAQWLRGERSPATPEEYERIAHEIGMHPAELLYGVRPDQTANQELIEFAEAYDQLSSSERAVVRSSRLYRRCQIQ